MGLRLSEGIAEPAFTQRTGLALDAVTDGDIMAQALDAGYLIRDHGRLRATPEGRKRLDALLAALVI